MTPTCYAHTATLKLCACPTANHVAILNTSFMEQPSAEDAAFALKHQGKLVCFDCGGEVVNVGQERSHVTAGTVIERLRELGVIPPTQQPVAVRSDALEMQRGNWRVTVQTLPKRGDYGHVYRLYFEHVSKFGPLEWNPMLTLDQAAVGDYVNALCHPFSKTREWPQPYLESVVELRPGLWEAVVKERNKD